jgi:hypothetical protein
MKQLSFTLKFYLFSGIFFFFYFSNIVSQDFFYVHLYHFLSIILLFFVYNRLTFKFEGFSLSNLLLNVSIISLIWIIADNIISYHYRGNFWVFNEADSIEYDKAASALLKSNLSFVEVLRSVGLGNLDFSDYGMIVYTYLNYVIIESNLMVNFSFWVIGILNAKLMYEIGLFSMDRRNAFFCALLFTTSTFMGWFNSSGLKESFMIFLVVLAFRNYYYYLYKGKLLKNVLFILIPIFLLFFFRPIVSIFFLFSIFATYVLNSSASLFRRTSIVIIGLIFVFGFNFIIVQEFNRYTGGSFDNMIEGLYAEEMVVGGNLFFNYAVQIISAVFGVFPSINPEFRLLLSFFYPSLLLKILLGFFFIHGTYRAIKKKHIIMLPIVIFCYTEIVALATTLEVLELRKNMPHFMMYYFIMFFSISTLDDESIKNRKLISSFNWYYSLIAFALILYWNSR